nr:PREDICTED: uncharacterized protein LOC108221820 [Daucus carota subsp. sativus]
MLILYVAFFLYPIFWILWEILYAPLRLFLGICNLIVFIFSNVYAIIGDIWFFISSIFQLASTADATVNAEVFLWHTLWNHLFSQVFRAVLSILNDFVAFFTACNRHQLRNSSTNVLGNKLFPYKKSYIQAFT